MRQTKSSERLRSMTSPFEIASFFCEKELKGRDQSLMYGNTGIALFLMRLWERTEKDKYYRRASDLIVEAFDFMTSQIHVHRLAPKQADLTFDTGIGGIAWGINRLIAQDFIECDFDDTMCLIDDFIFRQMIDGIYSKKAEDIRRALQICLYAVERTSRLSKEYVRRFVKEWRLRLDGEHDSDAAVWFKGKETAPLFLLRKIASRHPDIEHVEELQRVYGTGSASGSQDEVAAQARRRLLSLLEHSRSKPDDGDFRRWYTPSRGLYALHYGLKDGLAGIALSQLDHEPGDWFECLFE